MTQHFLHTTQARDLSLMKLFTMSDEEAFESFKANGEHYFLKTRKHFRCKECNHTFSVME